MRENGVFDRLYNQEPTSVDHNGDAMPGGETEEKLRQDIELFRTSMTTRDENV